MTHFHLIGIGGAGMSVVAQLLHARGHQISGSDRSDSAVMRELRDSGISAYIGHAAAHVDPRATVVVSSAIREDNPELMIARQRGQAVLHRSQALAIAAGDLRFVAVAGAHGKSTTSSMLAAALRQVGLDPSYAVGAQVRGLGSGAHLGSGEVFIAEADESDGSFLNYAPQIEVVTNVEPDHLDHYGSVDAFAQAFVDFAQRLQPGGVLITNSDDPGAAKLAEQHRQLGGNAVTYGQAPFPASAGRHVLVSDIQLSDSGASATLNDSESGEAITLKLQVTGTHNLLNATAAVLAGQALGVAWSTMADALFSFVGTRRRFEPRGEVGGRRLVDDYAHHPTEVAAALQQARVVAGDGRIVVLFQPHLFSRTKNFAREFGQALSLADTVVLAPIYAAREDPLEEVTSALIAEHCPRATVASSLAEAAEEAAAATAAGDLCLTMGAGDVTTMAESILSQWQGEVEAAN